MKYLFLSCSLLLLGGCSSSGPAPVSGIGPDYGQIQKGSYRGSYYQVKKGETLYFISYVTGKSVQQIVSYNRLRSPYTIYPGDKLKLWAPRPAKPYVKPRPKPKSQPKSKPVIVVKAPTTKPVAVKPVQKDQKKVDPNQAKEYAQQSKQNVNKSVTKPIDPVVTTKSGKVDKWVWPTTGKIIARFSSSEQGNKGIDITGRRGQAINAAAAGKVVYAGNALRGYGNLIIIKHNEDYLTAYAHNERILVKENQSIKAGQKIGLMGRSGTTDIRLHFEIRYKGKSVNPTRYLP
ncbi:peptidoglycan DD-metalloendopeptidase family protein [Vibrio sp. SS-MA-C1-2]|uniref:peptidoglycan DD-metalloendopeptidase family protein n=1 Tax=Vibrio sp. SS-MA-C1-2 TaxID=2908646 RepID=UPI001F2AA95A|nr:peptidoglycan DD-metalloendopeptidase family protein [Vibrio sp. SS-MA-C1-2]UJF19017.1 peptidoglycan DD-metalloendopeptidase family protein [Vibrio sp. SS-MA-C1-2]